MVSARNIDATAVNTIAWLSAGETSIVVPVYQRQYRWDIGGCEQLLADIRAVAAPTTARRTSSARSCRRRAPTATPRELVLIDGQQRITTLMLLIAALHHTVAATIPRSPPSSSGCWCARTTRARTKLRPHRAWAEVFESVVLDRRGAGRRAARVPVRRQLRVLPQPDPRRGGAAHLARGCRSSSTSRSRSAPARTRSRSSRASTPPASRCATTS